MRCGFSRLGLDLIDGRRTSPRVKRTGCNRINQMEENLHANHLCVSFQTTRQVDSTLLAKNITHFLVQCQPPIEKLIRF